MGILFCYKEIPHSIYVRGTVDIGLYIRQLHILSTWEDLLTVGFIALNPKGLETAP